MAIPSRTLGVLATVVASLGTLGAAASAQAQTAHAATTDTTPPPTVTSVAINGHDLAANNGTFYTNDTTDPATVTVTGDPSASSIELDGGNAGSQSATPTDGVATFTVPAPAFSSGYNTLIAEQTVDSTLSTPVYFGVQADVAAYLDGIQDGQTYTASDLSLDLGADMAIPGDAVELFIDGTQVANPSADSNGSVRSFDLGSPLSPGYHTAYAKSVDGEGNESAGSTPIGFYVAPSAPRITSPTSTPDQWAYLNTGQPTITVTGVDPGATVNLYEPNDQGQLGSALDSATSAQGGTVTLTPSSPVADGFDNFVVTQTETEGTGTNQKSVTSDFTDQSAQTNVNIVTSAPQLGSDVQYAPSTNNNKPNFTFEVPGVGGDANAKVRLIDANSGQTLGEASLQDYNWAPSTPLADGTYSVYAVAIDDLGNVGTAHSNPVDFTVDTVPPSTPSFTSPTDGSTVTTSKPTITVHGDAGTTMCVSIDPQTADEDDLPCLTADGNGNATFTPDTALSNGSHSLHVSSIDEAWNSSDASATITVNTANNGGGNGGGTNPTPTPTPTPQPPAPKPAPAPPAPKSVSLSSHTLSAQQPVKVSFQVSNPGTVVLTLSEQVKTKVKTKTHGKVKLVTKTITKVVGTVDVKVKKADKGGYTLTTKFAGHQLGKGNYTLSLQTTSGKSKSKPVTQTLSVH